MTNPVQLGAESAQYSLSVARPESLFKPLKLKLTTMLCDREYIKADLVLFILWSLLQEVECGFGQFFLFTGSDCLCTGAIGVIVAQPYLNKNQLLLCCGDKINLSPFETVVVVDQL